MRGGWGIFPHPPLDGVCAKTGIVSTALAEFPRHDGRRVADALRGAGVTVVAHEADRTERHLNLMKPTGERVSLYLSTLSPVSAEQQADLLTALPCSDHAVIDLTETGRSLSDQVRATPTPPTIWVDLHDYDGAAEFHEPFLRNADIVFMNGDATDDPGSLIRSCAERGPEIAVCALGAHGAIAVADDGVIVRTAAEPLDHIVDTNGAGDAFMAGFLAAHISGVPVAESLRAGARQTRLRCSPMLSNRQCAGLRM